MEKSQIHRLVVVDDGADPPESNDCCQDWMWRSGDEREMRLRLHQLSLRGLEHGHRKPEIDAWGMLRVGLRSIYLPAKQHALAAVLVRGFGRPVERDDLIRAAWPKGIDRPNMLASRISSMRPRLRWLGLEIRTSRAAASYWMCTAPTAATSDPAPTPTDCGGGFEEELTSAGWDPTHWRPCPSLGLQPDLARWSATPVVGVPGSLVGDVQARDQGRTPWQPPTTTRARGTPP